MRKQYKLTFRTELAASTEKVWEFVGTMEGVNAELSPLFRMTYPPAMNRLDPSSVPVGQKAFGGWILLFGVVPLEYDNVTFLHLQPGRGFVEASTLISQKKWRHERTLASSQFGCILTDRIEFIPRLYFSGRVFRKFFKIIFKHRHKKLRRKFRALKVSRQAPLKA